MVSMNTKDLILQYLQSHSQKKCTFGDIQSAIGLDENELKKSLQELESEYSVFEVEPNIYRTADQAGMVIGRISINRAGLGFIDREDRESIKIEQKDQAGAMDGDQVLVFCHLWQVYGRVIKILVRSKTSLVGTFVNQGHGLHLLLDDEKLQDRPIRILYDENFQPIEGLKVLCAIEKYDTPLTLRVIRSIGHKDDPGVDIMSILLEHDIQSEFPEEVMEQVNTIPGKVQDEELKGRKDLTQEITVTIDGDDSKDFDDAVSCVKETDGWLLKVSIADVSHYVQEGTPLDKEAYHRGCSTYVTDRVVPMLPHQLSNGICSLNPHVKRLTLTCEMHVASTGEITDYVIYPSWICSTERMTYNDVNEILNGNEDLQRNYSHLGDLFETLAECADHIRDFRIRKGAISFDSDESVIQVDQNGKPTAVYAKKRGHAEEIIEDCMIAANVCVANQMKWSEIPSVYRIHEEPSSRRIRDFVKLSEVLGHKFKTGRGPVHPIEIQQYLDSISDTDEFPVLSKMMLRSMQKAKYDSHCIGHFGLAEEEYLHFTSPIRRYPDLVVHRMLRKYLFESCTDMEEIQKDEYKCSLAAEQSSIRERASQDAEYECDDMKKAEYMAEHLGEVKQGIITSVTSFGFYVSLPNTIEGLVPIYALHDDYYQFDQERMELLGTRSHRVFQIGMKVTIRTVSADKQTRRIEFQLVGNNGKLIKHDHHRQEKKSRPRKQKKYIPERKAKKYGRKRKR